MANPQYTNLNAIIGKWLERTLWLWLPFYAIVRLTRETVEKYTKK